MKRSEQVAHVMNKDLRENRWSFGVYIALSVIATGSAVRFGQNGPAIGIAMPLLVLFGMIVVASLVQCDSPIRADAFWASRPLDPAAVLSAKFTLTVIAVIGIPLLGELIALITNATPRSELPAAIVASAWAYWKWLLLALVIGAVTTDLKSFLVALISIPTVVFLWAWIRAGETARVLLTSVNGAHYPLRDWALVVAGMLGCIALLAQLYRTRAVRPATWVAAFVLLLCAETTPAPFPERAPAAQVSEDLTLSRTTFRVGQNEVGMNRTGFSGGSVS